MTYMIAEKMPARELERRLREAMAATDAAGRRAIMDAVEAVAKNSAMQNLQTAARAVLAAVA